jgi:transposase
MSRMAKEGRSRRARRQFSEEFKDSAVRLVLDEGRTVGAVARELDLTASALGLWVRHARAERSQGRTGLTKAEREELTALRKENRVLREEREILKKAAAFFAKQNR